MRFRVPNPSREGNPHRQSGGEYPGSGGQGALLSARAAAILGASFLIAVIAGVLAYLTLGRFPANLAGAILAAGTAFAGAVRLLMAIVA
jgi:hypothetical protein